MFIPAFIAAAALLASPALASVQISIFQDGADTIAEAVGSLNLPPSVTLAHCGGAPGFISDGAISPIISAICLGPAQEAYTYPITGPSNFGLGIGKFADDSSGSFFGINGSLGLLATSDLNVNARSVWLNTSLADLGLKIGPVASWQAGDEQITMVATPAPLPLLGSISLFGWARKLRLRNRIK